MQRPLCLALAGVVMLLAAATGCGGGLGAAKADFRKGRLPEAKAELVKLEPESRGWDNQRRAEYALYRGLVLHSLGDRGAAAVWLNEARAIEDAHPSTLTEDDRVRLRLARESVVSDTAPLSP